MPVITISRQFGSGGDAIADRVCQLTGFRRLDKELVANVAAEAGLSEQEILDFSENDHRVEGFMDRLLRRSKPVGTMRVWKEHIDGTRYEEELPVDAEHALAMVQKLIRLAYRHGDWVIVGRGGQVLLRDRPDVLHLRIEAPLEDRIQRVKILYHLERRAAQDLIEEKDAISADYLMRFYEVDWAEPSLYQILINTGRLDLDLAAQLISSMIGCLRPVEASIG